MPRKDPVGRREYNREYQRVWYARNKQLQISRVGVSRVKRRDRLAEWINTFKAPPCADCGGDFPPYLMDFDHVTGEKLYDICGMRMRTVSREAIKAETEKCDVLCANCHRARTYKGRLGIEVQASEFVKLFGDDFMSVLIY